jgi:HD superfamily phosphodiesterase
MRLLTKLFNYVLITTKYYNIDESHGIMHSMDVLNFAHKIYSNEINNYPEIVQNKKVIYSSAILHDMCDKKYLNEKEGFNQIKNYFYDDFTPLEFKNMEKIITTMSYSKVKINGFPNNLNDLEIPYHIVREADLLSAYDFNLCLIYDMCVGNFNIYDSFNRSTQLFDTRVLNYISDNLFVTSTGKILANELETKSIDKVINWKNILE